jgi:hypothetical protein
MPAYASRVLTAGPAEAGLNLWVAMASLPCAHMVGHHGRGFRERGAVRVVRPRPLDSATESRPRGGGRPQPH